jgi:adenylate kinase
VPLAEALDKVLVGLSSKIDHVVSIDVDEEALVVRLTGRRTCKSAACGQMFHIKFTPPKKDGVCDKCGGELYQRDDDNETTVRSRLSTYNQATAPLIGYYSGKGLVRPIAGVGSIDDIFNKIVGIVSGGHSCACGR